MAIYISLGMSLCFCLIYIYLLSIYAEKLAWALVAFVQLGLMGTTLFFFTKYHDLRGKQNSNNLILLCAAITCLIVTIIYTILIYTGLKQLQMAINVFDASADYLAKTKRVLLVPIFYFLVTLGIVFLYVGGVIGLSTSGIITANTD